MKKRVAWFNISVAVFCGLASLIVENPYAQMVDAAISALNVFMAGMNFCE